jgi:hypothetical protein
MMNLDLIIEALEESLQMRCGNCRGPNDESCGGNCNIRDALTEARKMKEPCEMIELLSEYAHDAWSGWMRYLFSKSAINADGTVTIPRWAVERWRRQIGTKYSDLSDSEKMSDRKEAETILSIVQKLKEPYVPEWVSREIKATYYAATSCGSDLQAYRLFEVMTDRLGYGRLENNPSLVPVVRKEGGEE